MSYRKHLFAAVEQYALARLQQPLTIVGLCREFLVSERTLHYAFQDVVRMSPMAYFRLKRLHQARRALQSMDPATTTVHQVANAWGFWHTGEFAAAYRRQFGELPSTTARSSPRPRAACG
jgi:AraC family ethanolamine operon transcriptional activator